jgi:predicted exporter
MRKTFDALNARAGGGFRLAMAGVPVFSVAAHSEINRDVTLVSTLSSLFVVVVFLLLFRSFAALHWVMMIQVASFLVGALATAWLFGEVHSLTLALGASLIGICTDYPMHVMVHCAKHRHTPLVATRLLWPTLMMGGLTTVIGYAALGLTGFPGFEQIAVFALFSIVMSLVLTRWVLPSLLWHVEIRAAHLPGIGRWMAFCGRQRRMLLILVAMLTLLAIVSLSQLRWMDDMQNLAMDMSEIKREDEAVRTHFSHIEPSRFVLVEAADMETALQRSELVERRLKELVDQGGLKEYYGLFPWLVSDALQSENAAVYQQAVSTSFIAAWRTALTTAGLSVDRLGNLSAPSDVRLQPNAVLSGPASHLLSGRVLASVNGVALAIWLGDHDPALIARTVAGIDGVRYFSQKDQINRLAEHYRDQSLQMLAMGIVMMALFIRLQRRSWRKVGLTLLPTLIAVLFIFAIWALMGEEVSFLHVLGLLLSVSLCVDYGLFFMDNRGEDTEITYHAIASSTLTTLASFGALGLGETPTLPILALSVSLGVTLGFLLCPLLIPKPLR